MIDYSKPSITKEDRESWLKPLDWRQFDPGAHEKRFRAEVAERVGVRPEEVFLTNSCTTALEAIVHLFRPRLVVVPALTWPSTYCHVPLGQRVYRDVTSEGTIQRGESGRGHQTMIILVELWGKKISDEELLAHRGICDFLVLDSAQNILDKGIGERLESGLVDAVANSFGPIKQITTGHGGALFCREARRLEAYLHSGTVGPIPVEPFGRNCRMAEPAAALGLSQLGRFDAMQAHRMTLLERYEHHLGHGMVTQSGTHSGHLAVWEADDSVRRRLVAGRLYERDVRTTVHYQFPTFLDPRTYPVAYALNERVLTLPCHMGVTEEDVDTISKVVKET